MSLTQYECLSLKDAGFKFKEATEKDSINPTMRARIVELYAWGDNNKFIIPTLSEMIDQFNVKDLSFKVTKRDGRFRVVFDRKDEQGNKFDYYGDTLEEVFTHYWIEINKN